MTYIIPELRAIASSDNARIREIRVKSVPRSFHEIIHNVAHDEREIYTIEREINEQTNRIITTIRRNR